MHQKTRFLPEAGFLYRGPIKTKAWNEDATKRLILTGHPTIQEMRRT